MTAEEAFIVLGLKPGASIDMVRQAFREKALSAHPDVGGTYEAIHALRVARDVVLDYISNTPCSACDGSGKAYRGRWYRITLMCEVCGGRGKNNGL
jgi:DnaJ-class molecular chaperone